MRYSQEEVNRIASSLREEIRNACADQTHWETVATILAKAFPGAFAAIQNIDIAGAKQNFDVAVNIDPDFHASYREHYAFINPWLEFWRSRPSGTLAIAERHSPAHLLRGTEFYEDWLIPQGGVDSASGMKIDGDHKDQAFVVLHYPRSLSPFYDEAIAEVLVQARGSIRRAINGAKDLNSRNEKVSAAAAVVHRSPDAALVVDRDMKVIAANHIAEDLLRTGSPTICRGDLLTIAEQRADAVIRSTVERLADNRPVDRQHHIFARNDELWRTTFTCLPTSETIGTQLIVPQKRQVLLLFRNLSKQLEFSHIGQMAEPFHLTASEIAFCRLVAEGLRLADIADMLQITQGTARQRLKLIFQKTDTHRQSELALLLTRFG